MCLVFCVCLELLFWFKFKFFSLVFGKGRLGKDLGEGSVFGGYFRKVRDGVGGERRVVVLMSGDLEGFFLYYGFGARKSSVLFINFRFYWLDFVFGVLDG